MGLLEWIRDTYMDGYNEAKSEQETADALLSEEREKNAAMIPSIAIEKRILSAVAAPFRVVTFGDWFTMFKDAPENSEHLPLHLHTFGSELALTEEQVQRLKKTLDREFHVVDRSSALAMLEEMTKTNWLFFDDLVDKAEMTKAAYFRQPEMGAMYAILLAVSGLLVTASVDVGYLTEEEALDAVAEMLSYVPLVFDDWAEFNELFLRGNLDTKLNRGAGQRSLRKYTDYLLTKSGSPWQWLPMSEISQMKGQNRTTKR